MLWIIALATVVAAYGLGSLPFAVIVSRLMGLADPRTFGSNNPGRPMYYAQGINLLLP